MALSSTRILSSLLVLIVIACGIEGCAREYEGTTQYEACKESIELQYNTSKIFSIFLFRNWFPIFICNSDTCRYVQFVDNGQCLREYYYDHYARPDAQLLDAAVNGDITLARKALYQGAKVNAKDEDGYTALMKSAGFGHTAIVEVLLTKGADVNAKDKDGYTALMSAAAQSGDAASVEVLLTKGADVNTKNQHGFTALMKATERGYTAVVEVLLAKGADVNAKGDYDWTALMSAARFGDTTVVEVLLAKGADVNAKHKRGWTALSIAKENGYTDIVQLLKQAGAVMADEATKKPQETVRDLFNDPTFETMPFDVKLDRFYKASKNDHAYQKMSDDGKKVVHQRFFSSEALADPPQPR